MLHLMTLGLAYLKILAPAGGGGSTPDSPDWPMIAAVVMSYTLVQVHK